MGRQKAAKTWAGGLGGGRRGGATEKRDVSRHCSCRLGFCGLSRFLTQTLAEGLPGGERGRRSQPRRAGAAARAFRILSFFWPNPSHGVPSSDGGDGLGRGGRVPRPRERGSRTWLGLFGLSCFFGQTLAAGCPAANGATVLAAAGGCHG